MDNHWPEPEPGLLQVTRYILYIDTVLAMSLMFSLLKIIKEIYEMSLKPFVLF